MRVIPRQPAPRLDVPTVGRGGWALADRHPARFSLIVFYRGLHCPICRPYLTELNRLAAEFGQRGVEVVAVSTDDAVRAAKAVRDWGLYISTGRGKTSTGVEEPPKFAEPGVFLIRPDGSVYCAAVQSMPFARPHFAEILWAIDFVLKNDYPARGEA